MKNKATHEVIGNFPPGQMSFGNCIEAFEYAMKKTKEGFKVDTRRIIRDISTEERERYEAHKKRVLRMIRK